MFSNVKNAITVSYFAFWQAIVATIGLLLLSLPFIFPIMHEARMAPPPVDFWDGSYVAGHEILYKNYHEFMVDKKPKRYNCGAYVWC